jgi:hypothetical protein
MSVLIGIVDTTMNINITEVVAAAKDVGFPIMLLILSYFMLKDIAPILREFIENTNTFNGNIVETLKDIRYSIERMNERLSNLERQGVGYHASMQSIQDKQDEQIAK